MFFVDKVAVKCDCLKGVELKFCRHKLDFMRGGSKVMAEPTTLDDVKIVREKLRNTEAQYFVIDTWEEY